MCSRGTRPLERLRAFYRSERDGNGVLDGAGCDCGLAGGRMVAEAPGAGIHGMVRRRGGGGVRDRGGCRGAPCGPVPAGRRGGNPDVHRAPRDRRPPLRTAGGPRGRRVANRGAAEHRGQAGSGGWAVTSARACRCRGVTSSGRARGRRGRRWPAAAHAVRGRSRSGRGGPGTSG